MVNCFHPSPCGRGLSVNKANDLWNPNDFISKEVKFHDVLIEPYRVGILPALAGIYSRIYLGKKFNSLNEVHNHIAISNYYKFSIHDQKDVNPNRLRTYSPDRETYAEYFRIKAELVALELDALKPDVIMLLDGAHIKKLRKWKKSREISTRIMIINDPS